MSITQDHKTINIEAWSLNCSIFLRFFDCNLKSKFSHKIKMFDKRTYAQHTEQYNVIKSMPYLSRSKRQYKLVNIWTVGSKNIFSSIHRWTYASNFTIEAFLLVLVPKVLFATSYSKIIFFCQEKIPLWINDGYKPKWV